MVEIIDFKPPIKSRKTNELIQIAHSSTDLHSEEAIRQAKQELIRRRISENEQTRKAKAWQAKREKQMEEYQRELTKNETERYALGEKFGIFLLTPLILSGRFSYTIGPALTELKERNYKTKYRQRLILLIFGGLFYCVLYILYKYIENQNN